MSYMKTISAFIGGVIGFLFGKIDGVMLALISFVIFDYITGLISACVNHELSSEVGYKGIAKKIMIFVIVAIANIIDTKLINHGAILRTASIFFYISNEGISILENAIEIGIPIPNKIKEMLIQLKENDNESIKDSWEE